MRWTGFIVRNKQFLIKLTIPYVDINIEQLTAQLLTKHAHGNVIISDEISLVVVQRGCCAPVSGLKRTVAFVGLQLLKHFYQ